jgi:hypothetical protein
MSAAIVPGDRQTTSDRPSDRGATGWGRVAAVALLLSAGLSVLLTAFAWPAARSAVHGVPLAVAGPAPAAAQVRDELARQRPGAFDVRMLADESAAVRAIRDREVYGAIVIGASGPTVLTASAASPAVAQGLAQLAQALSVAPAGQGGGAATPVRDVVAAPADDPRGAGLAAGALPLVIGGIVAAGALTQVVRGAVRRLTAAIGVAVVGGLAMTAILHSWIGALAGDFVTEWGVVALSFAAISITLLGLEWLLGPPGLGLGAATMLLLGNPFSGITSAPEMLPDGWGTLGRLLPPGATGTSLRSVAFFDGAGAGGPLLVLACWLAAGLAMCAVGAARGRPDREAGPVSAPASR